MIDADLRETDLGGAYMLHTNLRGVNVAGADLYGARREDANLRDLELRDANLTGAMLQEHTLERGRITDKQLDHAGSLPGLIIPDGTRHASYDPDNLSKNLTQFGKPCIVRSSLLCPAQEITLLGMCFRIRGNSKAIRKGELAVYVGSPRYITRTYASNGAETPG